MKYAARVALALWLALVAVVSFGMVGYLPRCEPWPAALPLVTLGLALATAVLGALAMREARP